MEKRFALIRTVSLILLLTGFLLSVSSCKVVHPRYRVRHDSGLHKGWYKSQHKSKRPAYKYHKKGPKAKKAKGRSQGRSKVF